MAPLIKKKQGLEDAKNEAELPKQARTDKIGKPVEPASETDDDISESESASASVTEPKIRLSTDIDERAYINLKCYATVTRRSVVSILNSLIYTHCPVKISM